MEPGRERRLKEESILQRFIGGFKDRFGEGREDYRIPYYAARQDLGKDPEDIRIRTTLGTNPSFVTFQERTGRAKPEFQEQRRVRGMGLSDDPAIRRGQYAGTFAQDLTQDHSRGLWWLLNAPQAVGNVINEAVISKSNPELFKHKATTVEEVKRNPDGSIVNNNQNRKNLQDAIKEDLVSDGGTPLKGIGTVAGKKKEKGPRGTTRTRNTRYYSKRQFNPGDVAALGIPTGIAINAGIGLLNPFGGSGGYEAAIPSEDDKTKTANVIAEVGAKYILGKTGNLLPYSEFVQERPDVSKGEYNSYRAFKYDKDTDLNPFDDGRVTLPGGFLKATTDGIHGPEVQYLGRSLPLTTALIPYAGALAGGALGVSGRIPGLKGKPIRDGMKGGMGGLAVGTAAGLITEELRRRASSTANDQLGAQ